MEWYMGLTILHDNITQGFRIRHVLNGGFGSFEYGST